MEIERTYIYNRNGKDVKIKRSWTKSNANINKNEKLNEYFNNNLENIKTMKNIKAVYANFMETYPDSKVSYSMLYNKYQKHFNTRKAQQHPRRSKVLESKDEPKETPEQVAEEDTPEQDKPEDYEEVI